MRRRKRAHYQSKLDLTEKKIWDTEFLKENLFATREGIRREYDRLTEQTAALHERIRGLTERNAEGDKEQVEEAQRFLERLTPDIEQLKAQMDAIDAQITGNGGVDETIKGYHEVAKLLKKAKANV